MSLKSLIAKNEITYYIAKSLNGLFDAEYRRRILNYDTEISSVNPIHKGEKNKGKVLCAISLSGDDTSGICSFFNSTCQALYYCYIYNLYPVIDWSGAIYYREDEKICGTDNPFEYYFEQYDGMQISDLKNSFFVVENGASKSRGVWERLGGGKLHYYYPEEMIRELGLCCRKYLHLNNETKTRLGSEEVFRQVTKEKTLGVQIRMGDMKLGWGMHPQTADIEEYLEIIEQNFEGGGISPYLLPLMILGQSMPLLKNLEVTG